MFTLHATSADCFREYLSADIRLANRLQRKYAKVKISAHQVTHWPHTDKHVILEAAVTTWLRIPAGWRIFRSLVGNRKLMLAPYWSSRRTRQ